MLKLPKNWNDVKANDGTFRALPAGAYDCIIKQAKVTNSKKSGNEMLVLCLDIAGGEHAGYFTEQFNHRRERNSDAKWPAVSYTLTGLDVGREDPRRQGMLKHVVMSIEESNNGFKWTSGDEAEFNGKHVGCVFREEEYSYMQNGESKIGVGLRCDRIIPVSGIKDAKIPARKALDGAEAQAAHAGTSRDAATAPAPIAEDDLPF